MTKQRISGMYWHGFRKPIVGWTPDFDARREQIKRTEPKWKVPTYLRLMRMVRGELPDELVQGAKAVDKAGWVCAATWWEYGATWAAYETAWAAYDSLLAKYAPEIKALHDVECPNCTWNGTEIEFPQE